MSLTNTNQNNTQDIASKNRNVLHHILWILFCVESAKSQKKTISNLFKICQNLTRFISRRGLTRLVFIYFTTKLCSVQVQSGLRTILKFEPHCVILGWGGTENNECDPKLRFLGEPQTLNPGPISFSR